MAKNKLQKKLLIAQEIKFARALSSNDKKTRLKMLKKLRSWIKLRCNSCFAFTEEDFMRLWKGLFYCMWMSDKPLSQEEFAESISNLIHCFESVEPALMYTKCTLTTLSTEWFGIDRYRIDKFEMLVRRIIRQTFVMCKKRSWDEEWVKGVSKIIEDILLDTKGSMGFKFHITELYMEELSKISEGNISEDIVTELLRPFAIHLSIMTDDRQIRHVMKHIFRLLIFQSDVGLDYAEKFKAWRQAGFPTGEIDAMQKIEVSDEECNENAAEESDTDDEGNNENIERVLDPRAGRVDVELPQVPFDSKQIANLLQSYKFHESSTTKTRRQIMRLISEFNELAKGNMPLGVKKVKVFKGKNKVANTKSAARKLLQFEDKLYNDSHNRVKRKKKRKSIVNMEDDDNDDNNEDSPPKKKKIKKQKANEKINFEDSGTQQESNKKSMLIKKKRKQNLNVDESEGSSPKGVIKKLKLKQKSLKQNTELKEKKVSIKKLKNKQKNLKNLILDGLEDLAIKYTPSIKKKKKKVKHDLENSTNFLNIECPSTSTAVISTSIPVPNGFTLPVKPIKKKILVRKNVSNDKVTVKVTKKLKNKLSPKKASPIKKSNINEPNKKKRVKIVLHRNTAQHTSEYIQQLRSCPAIPFDANRKPLNGVLKSSPISSPINPFYKK